MAEVKKVAPDGGWGWIIVIGFGISNIISIPVIQSFTLLFRNIFVELNLSATDISTIINVNSGFGLMLGLMNGPLLRTYGYRKYAVVGSILMFVGFLLTSQASSFYELVIFYGTINSVGLSMNMAAFSLALNTYFREKRAMAAGFTTTLTGLGPIFMPLFISRFVEIMGARQTAVLLAGLLLHSIPASLLLHPIKWHYKYINEEEVLGSKEMQLLNPPMITETECECKHNKNKEDEDDKIDTYSQSGYGIEEVVLPRRISDATGRRSSISHSRLSMFDKDTIEPESMWWKGSNIGSTNDVFKRQESKAPSVPNEPPKAKWYQKVIKFFDLDLLKDPVYRNIWIGMSLAFTGEINFSLMTPVILGDRKFGIEDTATIMSVIATTDIIFRFISPFIGDKAKIPARKMYMISLLMLMATRFALTFVYSYWAVIGVGAAIGVAKGFRTVYMTLVIPNHVPLEKLPSASGLQTVLNGILLLAFGPIVGFARDYYGNYNAVIHMVNFLSFSTIVLWTAEMCFMRNKKNPDMEDK